MCPRPIIASLTLLLLTACSGEIYLRDGVTDGDTFYLSQRAFVDDNPVLQSWVSYSLSRSTCQLGIGGENPARETSFDCEFSARELLADSWSSKKALAPNLRDDYLDELLIIRDADYLQEHVIRHFGRRSWNAPIDLNAREYKRWLASHIPDHKPETRWIGSWNYANNVRPN